MGTGAPVPLCRYYNLRNDLSVASWNGEQHGKISVLCYSRFAEIPRKQHMRSMFAYNKVSNKVSNLPIMQAKLLSAGPQGYRKASQNLRPRVSYTLNAGCE